MDNLPQTLDDANPGFGHNSEQALKDLVSIGRKAVKGYDKACAGYRKNATEAQVHALVLGRVIHEGKQLHRSTKAFRDWLVKNKLDVGSLGAQPEYNACMHLYERVILNKEFTLDGCEITTPTNIMKWARRQYAHLFESRPKAKKRAGSLIEQVIELVQETPIDIGIKLHEALKGSKELASFKRALTGKVPE